MPVLKIYSYGAWLLLATTLVIYAEPTVCSQETGVALAGITAAWLLFGYPMLVLVDVLLAAWREP